MRPLRWVSKSHDKLATALRAMGTTQLLEHSQAAGGIEVLPPLQPQDQGRRQHPDRDAQFEYINAKVEEFQAEGQPVISIDAKKKELLGGSRTATATIARRVGRSRSTPTFEDKELGEASPTGSTTSAPTTATSALHRPRYRAIRRHSVRLWLDRIGRQRYHAMKRLMITADGGGSNGSRLRLWKTAPQQPPTKLA